MFFSDDHGKSWKPMDNLPFRDVNGMNYDAKLKRLLVTPGVPHWVLAVSESDRTFKYWDCGWSIHSVRSSGGRLVGASLFDGVIMQPIEPTVAATGTNCTCEIEHSNPSQAPRTGWPAKFFSGRFVRDVSLDQACFRWTLRILWRHYSTSSSHPDISDHRGHNAERGFSNTLTR